MPVHWTISHPSRLVVAVTKGDVTLADMEKYFAGVTAEDAMSYRKIFEITHAPGALSEAAVFGVKLFWHVATWSGPSTWR
jgi:hypothetical protein